MSTGEQNYLTHISQMCGICEWIPALLSGKRHEIIYSSFSPHLQRFTASSSNKQTNKKTESGSLSLMWAWLSTFLSQKQGCHTDPDPGLLQRWQSKLVDFTRGFEMARMGDYSVAGRLQWESQPVLVKTALHRANTCVPRYKLRSQQPAATAPWEFAPHCWGFRVWLPEMDQPWPEVVRSFPVQTYFLRANSD